MLGDKRGFASAAACSWMSYWVSAADWTSRHQRNEVDKLRKTCSVPRG